MDLSDGKLRACVVVVGLILVFSGTGFASQSGNHTSLCRDTRAELGKAVAAVAEASRRDALWIPAQEALESAKAAFKRGDHKETILYARMALHFVELGLKQRDTGPYQHF